MDAPLFTLLGFGFVVGLTHAFEADHVAAVSTIVSQTRSLRRSSFLGAVWGLGHTSMLFLVGLLLLVFKLAVPESVALSLEFAVGIMLVLLGFGVVRKVFSDRVHAHPHQHGSKKHVHFHSHKKAAAHKHAHRSFLVGLVHGLAGSAALMLLVLATVNSVSQGLLYILVFGLGSVVGMLLMGGILAVPFLLASRITWLNSAVRLAAGSASMFLGVFLMYNIAVAF